MNIFCEVSLGELADKMTILEIKLAKIKDEQKRSYVKTELNKLKKTYLDLNVEVDKEILSSLHAVNLELWEIEDKIRLKESEKKFDEEFVELARRVYLTNDKRFSLKNEINTRYDSGLREVKDYQSYELRKQI